MGAFWSFGLRTKDGPIVDKDEAALELNHVLSELIHKMFYRSIYA